MKTVTLIGLFLCLASSAQAKVVVQSIRNDYSSTNVTTSAYVQLDSSLNQDTRSLEIFDSSGRTLVLARGASGSEVDLPFYIVPGGNANIVDVGLLPRGTRLSIKAVDASATTGVLILNLYSQ